MMNLSIWSWIYHCNLQLRGKTSESCGTFDLSLSKVPMQGTRELPLIWELIITPKNVTIGEIPIGTGIPLDVKFVLVWIIVSLMVSDSSFLFLARELTRSTLVRIPLTAHICIGMEAGWLIIVMVCRMIIFNPWPERWSISNCAAEILLPCH